MFSFPPIYSNFDSNLMSFDSYPSPRGAVEWLNITFSCLCLFLVQPRQSREESWSDPRETERSSALLVPKPLQCSHSTSQAKESWTGGPSFWRCWECSQHFHKNTGVETDRSRSQLVCHWPQVNYQESGRERRRLAQNWLHQHANPLGLYFSWLSPDLESREQFWCVTDYS